MASMDELELLRAENTRLRARICELENRSASSHRPKQDTLRTRNPDRVLASHSLSNSQIRRYSRQLILPQLGPSGQSKLSSSSVLVVGAGGLGAPVLLYLAAAGIGRIGIVDGDSVEADNLHRQVIHSEETIGMCKAESARDACKRLNSDIEVVAYSEHLTSSNAMQIAMDYDILVSATDNVPARYLVSDVSVLLNKPHVSGSALRLEGQLTVYHYKGGPCYRCLFPEPPAPDTVTNCSDGGVLGAVPGVIGCLQALEVLKIAAEMEAEVMSGRMFLFDAAVNRVMNIKLRARDSKCAACGDNPSVLEPVDYVVFCGSRMDDKPELKAEIEEADMSLAVAAFAREAAATPHVLLDVRTEVQYQIAALPNSINIPLAQFISLEEREAALNRLLDACGKAESSESKSSSAAPVFVICRRGVDSLVATKLLRQSRVARVGDGSRRIQNVRGGLVQWAKLVDTDFPVY